MTSMTPVSDTAVTGGDLSGVTVTYSRTECTDRCHWCFRPCCQTVNCPDGLSYTNGKPSRLPRLAIRAGTAGVRCSVSPLPPCRGGRGGNSPLDFGPARFPPLDLQWGPHCNRKFPPGGAGQGGNPPPPLAQTPRINTDAHPRRDSTLQHRIYFSE